MRKEVYFQSLAKFDSTETVIFILIFYFLRAIRFVYLGCKDDIQSCLETTVPD